MRCPDICPHSLAKLPYSGWGIQKCFQFQQFPEFNRILPKAFIWNFENVLQ
jgi:hypothetical protein